MDDRLQYGLCPEANRACGNGDGLHRLDTLRGCLAAIVVFQKKRCFIFDRIIIGVSLHKKLEIMVADK